MKKTKSNIATQIYARKNGFALSSMVRSCLKFCNIRWLSKYTSYGIISMAKKATDGILFKNLPKAKVISLASGPFTRMITIDDHDDSDWW